MSETYSVKEYQDAIHEICSKMYNFLTDYENSTDDADSDDFLSDGEWLDEFYTMLAQVMNELEVLVGE